jgi:hypothetical protein
MTTNANPAEALWDSTACANFLGLGNQKTLNAWRLRRQGPPYFCVGRLVRYEPSAVRAWLDARRVSPPATVAP